jgi:hypothetical protein
MTLQEKEDRVAWLHANNVNVGTLDDFGLLIWDAVRRMTPEQKREMRESWMDKMRKSETKPARNAT